MDDGRSPKPARLELLGHPRLVLADGTTLKIASRRAMILLALIAMSDRGERSRVWLQQILWGSRPQRQAQSSLRRELANLRKTLEGAGLNLLHADLRSVWLDYDRVCVDVHDQDYAGSASAVFLEGIDLAGENEFEDWLRDARSALDDLRARGAGSQVGEAVASPRFTPSRNTVLVVPTFDSSARPGGQEVALTVTQLLIDFISRKRWLPVAHPGSVNGGYRSEREDEWVAQQVGARHVLRTEIIGRGDALGLHAAMIEVPGQIIRWNETRWLGSDVRSDTLRDEIARTINIVCEIFEQGEQRQSSVDSQSLLDPMQLSWKIRFHINQFSKHDFALADELIAVAMANYPAHCELLMLRANLALWKAWITQAGPEDWLTIAPLIRAAMRADPLDARGPLFAGILDTWRRRPSTGIATLEHATNLDPASAHAFSHLGAAHYLAGQPERAIEPLERALYLAPIDPKRFHAEGQLAVVHWMLGESEAALAKVAAIRATHPGYMLASIMEAACLADLGDDKAAHRVRASLRDAGLHRYLDTISWLPFVDSAWNARLRAAITGDART